MNPSNLPPVLKRLTVLAFLVSLSFGASVSLDRRGAASVKTEAVTKGIMVND